MRPTNIAMNVVRDWQQVTRCQGTVSLVLPACLHLQTRDRKLSGVSVSERERLLKSESDFTYTRSRS
jgi:hypothetical protein